MRKTLKYSLTLLALLNLFVSCGLSVIGTKDMAAGRLPGDKITVNFTIGESNARTAMPQDVSWGGYKYKLEITPSVGDKMVLENKEYNELSAAISEGTYTFELTGYEKNGSAVSSDGTIYGVVDNVVIDSDWAGEPIRFVMKPATGFTGRAEFALTYPTEVRRVEAFVSTSFIPPASLPANAVVNNISEEQVISFENLNSGVQQFAFFYFYDDEAAGNCVASCLESIIVVGGKTSFANVTVSGLGVHSVQVQLKKNSSSWLDSGKQIVLVSMEDSDNAIVLIQLDREGNFSKTVQDGPYRVYVRNYGASGNGTYTGKNITVPCEPQTVDFISTKIPSNADGDAVLVPVEPLVNALEGTEENEYLINSESSGMDVRVQIKNGYGTRSGDVFTKAASVSVSGHSVADNSVIKVTAGNNVIVQNDLPLIPYYIVYNTDGGSWINEPTDAKRTYTVENYTISLPGKTDVVKNIGGTTYFFDGWADASGNAFSRIPEGTTGDLTLQAIWKEGVIIRTAEKAIYACGFNLTVKWNSDKSQTEVWYTDTNEKISGNFNDYDLYADYPADDGRHTGSEFIFTITGGRIKNIIGLGTIKPSTINISGSPVIGTGFSGGTDGIQLNTVTNEIVYVDGQMEGDYYVTLITTHKYEKGKPFYKLAYFNDANYAQMGHFKCLNTSEPVDEQELEMGIMNGTGDSKILYLRDVNPISLPQVGEIGVNEEGGLVWVEDEETGEASHTDFTLGNGANVGLQCSVFSVFVENGSFALTTTSMLDMNGNPIETDNLVHDASGAYTNAPVPGATYTYLHMMSKTNEITPETTSAFLKTIVFKKKSEGQKLTLNIKLETVPYDEITRINGIYKTAEKDVFKYYDGSFYLNVSGTLYWDAAYNKAKSIVFNGLNGYLVTTTSEVERKYLFDPVGLGCAGGWTGGTKMVPAGSEYDKVTYSTGSTGSNFVWQSGPEAGMPFSNGNALSYSYLSFQKNPSKTGEVCIMYHNNGSLVAKANDGSMGSSGAPQSCIVEFRPYTILYDGTPAPNPQKANYPSVIQTAEY